MPCTEHVRLCVERNKHSWSCPVKRLRSRGAERSQAPMSSAPAEPSRFDLGNVSRCRVFEQPGRAISSGLAEPSEFERHFSSAPAKPSGLERPFRAPKRSRAGSSGHFERPGGAERARAAVSSAPAEPSGPRSSKRRQEQCFRSWAEPAERVRLWNLWSSQGPLRKFRIRYI